MGARFLLVSDQILRTLRELEGLISSIRPEAQRAALVTAAQIASTERLLCSQIESLPASPLHRFVGLRDALEKQQSMLRELSTLHQQHTLAPRHESAILDLPH